MQVSAHPEWHENEGNLSGAWALLRGTIGKMEKSIRKGAADSDDPLALLLESNLNEENG